MTERLDKKFGNISLNNLNISYIFASILGFAEFKTMKKP